MADPIERYQYGFSFSEVLRTLLDTWSPIRDEYRHDAATVAYMSQLWGELRSVAGTSAWRPTAALAGQLLEAQLKVRLVLAGVTPAQMMGHDGTLGRLADRARRLGLFQPPSATMSLGGGIYSATKLRNTVSHSSPWTEHPTESHATFAVVLLISLTGVLFPSKTRDLRDVRQRLRELGMDDTQTTEAEALDLTTQLLQGGSLKTFLGIHYREVGLTQRGYQALVHEQFSYILDAAGRASIDRVMHTIVKLKQLGLGTESKCLAAALPYDDAAIAYLLQRSPNATARYLYMCKKADPVTFRSQFPKSNIKAIGRQLEALAESPDQLANISNILRQLPVEASDSIVARICARIRRTSNIAKPGNCVGFLALPYESEVAAELVQDIRSTLVQLIATAPAADISSIPLQLTQLGILDDMRNRVLLEALLSRAISTASDPAECAYGRRILWDVGAFTRGYDVRLKSSILLFIEEVRRHGVIASWEVACAIGAMTVLDPAYSPLDAGHWEANWAWRDDALETVDRWQIFLAFLAFSRVGTPTAEDVLEKIGDLHRSTREAQGRSKILMELVATELSEVERPRAFKGEVSEGGAGRGE